MAERKAANVLPDPVGAAISTSPPCWITGQARRWGSVGSAKRLANQRSMTGWKRDSGIGPEIYPKTCYPRRAAMRSMVSPILLLGVDAPAVMPIVNLPSGNHRDRKSVV